MRLVSLFRKTRRSSFPRLKTASQNLTKNHCSPKRGRCTAQKVSLASPPSRITSAKPNASSPSKTPNLLLPPSPPDAAPYAAKPAAPSPSFSLSNTRSISKLHHKPKPFISSRHSSVAEEALNLTMELPSCSLALENLFLSYELRLYGSDDYNFLFWELASKGECLKAMQWYQFAVQREKKPYKRSKLATSMISIFGRLGKVELAKNVFDFEEREGYGNTVYTYSTLISVYGRSGYCHEAVTVFETMKHKRLKPSLVTYNALIGAYGRSGYCDEAVGVFEMMKGKGLKPTTVTYTAVISACAKRGDIKRVLDIFNEMLSDGVSPNLITFNSVLAVCSRGGLWEQAMTFFSAMVYRGVDPDIITYNTLLDAVCKGGKMDLAVGIMSTMVAKNLMPNTITYNTVIDGYAKVGNLDDALNLYNKMRLHGVGMDTISYNTLVSIYANLGKFEEALNTCQKMESAGIRKDVITYNTLLGGFGKLGKYDQVKNVLKQMKSERVMPDSLTYSTLIDAYSKGGLHKEAMLTFKEFKKAGVKANVVLYNALIDSLCKNGMLESAMFLLDVMTREGIKPDVVTYNTIIDILGRSAAVEDPADAPKESNVNRKNLKDFADNSTMQIFGQLAAERSSCAKKFNCSPLELQCILGIFHKMHDLEIRPDVVTFSAVLNSCSHSNSFDDASMLLEELRLFDDVVYGVTHGLLTGCREDIWPQAQVLFDEVKQMALSTASTFYNALTDLLWQFGQRYGAQRVVLEGKRRNVWENAWSESCLDLHLMSLGAARAMVHAWLLSLRSIVFNGHELPEVLTILTGWGKHSKLVGDGALRRAIEGLLTNMGAPFHIEKSNIGRFISTGTLVATWLKDSCTLKLLVLMDERTSQFPPQSTTSDHERKQLPQTLPL